VSQTTPRFAVVGSGAAGLAAACVIGEHHRVHVLTDRQLGKSNSVMAQGGLHVPFSSPDSEQSMIDDIIRSGVNVDHTLVRSFVSEIRPTIKQLESWGLHLDRDDSGGWTRSLAGGLSEPRIIGTGDSIGPSVLRVLKRRAQSLDLITTSEGTTVDSISRCSSGKIQLSSGGKVIGAFDSVVFATGGSTYEWANSLGISTTNPPNDNRTASQLLHDFGLSSIDPDEYQWHPFGIVGSETSAGAIKAVPETICHFDVALLDRHGSEIAPILSGRRRLSEASFLARDDGRLVEAPTGGSGVCLTTSRLSPDTLNSAFPQLSRTMTRRGLLDAEAAHDLVVWPAPHYQLGGLKRRSDCSTSQPGLFLAGEIAGGVHGKNRLMGNGLTESLATGMVAARSAIMFAEQKELERSMR